MAFWRQKSSQRSHSGSHGADQKAVLDIAFNQIPGSSFGHRYFLFIIAEMFQL